MDSQVMVGAVEVKVREVIEADERGRGCSA